MTRLDRLHLSLRENAAGLADVIFPPACVHCRNPVERDGHGLRYVCAACAPAIDRIESPHCITCGHPFYGEVDGEKACPHCEGLMPEFDEGRTVTLFKGPVRSMIIELKYHRGLHVLRDVETFAGRSAAFLDFIRDAVLVPVPLHARKLRERGYNQAQLLAEAFARAADGETRVENLLRRVVDTETQTAFDRHTRMGNLKNAFALASRADLNPALLYIIVDDVFTTGSTVNRCAHVLRRAGALNLRVATFGHG
jgi:ComF family protein